MSIERVRDPKLNAQRLVGDAGPSEPATGPVRWSISNEQAMRLSTLARGKQVLEIGTGTGVSTEALALTAKSVATFDVDDEVRRLVWPGLPGNVVPFDRRHEPLRQGGAGFDLAFIDGLHSEEAVVKDIEEVFPLMRPDAVWVFHDFHMAGVERAVTNGPVKFRVLEVQSDKGPTTMAICERRT